MHLPFPRKSVHDSQPQISRVDELKASPGQGQNSPTQPSQQDRAAAKRAEQRRAEQERRRREAVSGKGNGDETKVPRTLFCDLHFTFTFNI